MNYLNAKPVVTLITMTPEIAAKFMSMNTANRPLNMRRAKTLAAAIMRGEWELNGDTIRVSKSGKLIDGQHRCAAVVESGIAIQVFLATGLDDQVFGTIDRGAGRTSSDTFAIQGEPHSAAIAAISRLLYVYLKCGSPYSGNYEHLPTTQQQVKLYQANPGILDSARWIGSAKWCKRHLPPSLAGFCHFLFHENNSEAAASFFDGLETGSMLLPGSPVLLLRNRLIDAYSSKDKLATSYRAGLLFKAFKSHRDGRQLKHLRVRTEGGSPEKDVFSI